MYRPSTGIFSFPPHLFHAAIRSTLLLLHLTVQDRHNDTYLSQIYLLVLIQCMNMTDTIYRQTDRQHDGIAWLCLYIASCSNDKNNASHKNHIHLHQHVVLLRYCRYDFYHDILELSYSYRIFIVIFPVRAWRYICAALLQRKHDRFASSLPKFQHASLHATAYRERRSACDCATLGEQRFHEIPPQLPLKLCRRWSGAITITSVCQCCGLQFSVLCSGWIDN